MPATPTGNPIFQYFHPTTNLPLVGGKVYTYIAGTLTPATTWADADKISANPNPIILNSGGKAQIFLDGAYKFIIKDALNNTIDEEDDIVGGTGIFDRPASGVTSLPFDDIVATNVQAALEELGLKRIKTNDSTTLVSLLSNYLMPAGVVAYFARNSAPAGWRKANGASLLRASFPDLFTAIGTTFGAPDGTHFQVPNIRGRWIRAWDDGNGIDTGRVFGSTQTDGVKAHTHSATFSGDALAAHSHTTPLADDDGLNGNRAAFTSRALDHNISVSTVSAGTPSGSVAVATNSGSTTEQRVNNIALLACISTGGVT